MLSWGLQQVYISTRYYWFCSVFSYTYGVYWYIGVQLRPYGVIAAAAFVQPRKLDDTSSSTEVVVGEYFIIDTNNMWHFQASSRT